MTKPQPPIGTESTAAPGLVGNLDGGVQSPRTCTTPSWMRTGNVVTGS